MKRISSFNDLTENQKQLYFYLKDRTTEDGWGITNYDSIKKYTNLCNQTIYRSIQTLEQNGYIKTESSFKGTKYKILKDVDNNNVTNDINLFNYSENDKVDKVNELTDLKTKCSILECEIFALKTVLGKQTKYIQECINELKSEYKRHHFKVYDDNYKVYINLHYLNKINDGLKHLAE